MLYLFSISLLATLIITRAFAYKFHDMKNYGTKSDKSKTITGYLRKITGKDIHHYHIGILILLIAIPSILLNGYNNSNIMFLAIGLSLFADQIVPAMNREKNYFHKSQLMISIALHLIVMIFGFALIE